MVICEDDDKKFEIIEEIQQANQVFQKSMQISNKI